MGKNDVGLIFGYASAGLGHLRVTDALFDGKPAGYQSLILNPMDEKLRTFHRLTSVQPGMRKFFEWWQNGLPAEIFTRTYVAYLRYFSANTRKILENAIRDWRPKPAKIVVICTHFGLAHQLAFVKKKVEVNTGVKIILAVQVTDDSPQNIWYVEGADLIFVPSKKTKAALVRYGHIKRFKSVDFEVNPYPVSLKLSRELTAEELPERQSQYQGTDKSKIHIAIPISGAAVGTEYNEILIKHLLRLSDRFVFHIVSKRAPYTGNFIKRLTGKNRVKIEAFKSDREVVDAYEKVYSENVISLEVTKPSEQAFKLILSQNSRGGVIILFTQPVGRQEYDNLDFLVRHNLIPDRAVRLPMDPTDAANFIAQSIMDGTFAKMTAPDLKPGDEDEMGGDGVARFWKKLENYLE